MKQYLLIGVWIVATAAWMVGFWAITESMKKTREAGFRYWAINPLAAFHSLRSKEFLMFLVSSAVMAAAVSAGFML